MDKTEAARQIGLTDAEYGLIDDNNPTYWWDLDEQSKIDSSNSAFQYINYDPDETVANTTFQAGPTVFKFTLRATQSFLGNSGYSY